MTTGLASALDDLLAQAQSLTAGTELAGDVEAVGARLRRPVRIAIAGRAKAGKSTLLNALVGERLAATDATECTRVVTWYRYDLGYSVAAVLRAGGRRSLAFDRADGLQIELGGLAIDEIDRIEIGWPSSRLASMTLIDTPGLDSANAATADRTTDALLGNEPGASEADAVLYLMRHLHRRDAEFLEAFERASIRSASPVNAVALLSRTDEIGSGRLDALHSAAAIARRYASDPDVSSLVFGVLPIAGLLAETGASLREGEVSWLREIVALQPPIRGALLLSADRFRNRDDNPLSRESREILLARFGLFGLRLTLDILASNPGLSTPQVAARLVEAAGIGALEAVIRRHFSDRAEALKARSALARMRVIARRAQKDSLPDAERLLSELERVESSSPELSELRLRHLVRARIATLADQERTEVERLLGDGTFAERLAAPAGTGGEQLRPLVLDGIERWRTRGADPMADRATAEVAEGVVRAYEGLYQALG